MLTTKQAAAELNLQPRSVKQLCQRGVLKAEKIGRDWLIKPSEVKRYKIERKSAGRPKQMKTFTFNRISVQDLSATDLHSEIVSGAKAYSIVIYDAAGIERVAEAAEALYADGRLGIAWGADATWADVSDVESGIEMWLNDGDAWERAN